MTNETITLLKDQFEKYDAILRQIGLELCKLNQDNVTLKARLNKLEKDHLIGSEHMIKTDFHKGSDYE